jgi:hypothetical protein
MENELDGNVALASGILSNSDDSDVEDKYELPEGEGGKQNKKKRTAPGDSSSSSDEIDEAERIAKIKAKKKARRKKVRLRTRFGVPEKMTRIAPRNIS